MWSISKSARFTLFAISHVLREFGYHKESTQYFVKPKGEMPVVLNLEERNTWHRKHFDWNGREKYVKSMGDSWEWTGGLHYNVFSEFPKDGYLCTIPAKEQVIAFAERKGFQITNINNLYLTLKEIILAYRKVNNLPTAFNKYIKQLC